MQTSTNSYLKNKITWAAPSNIALVKYWGKKGFQLPANSSISLTLKKAFTQTSIYWNPKNGKGIEFEFLFDGKENQKFYEKLHKVLSNLLIELPFLDNYKLKVETFNTFPHSTGIASSASSMAALALCLATMEKEITPDQKDFFKRASYLARIGSGSASRSIYGGFVSWGELGENSSDFFSTQIPKYHNKFRSLKDYILIVSKEEKKLPSSLGHQLMNDYPLAKERYLQANSNSKRMLEILIAGDFCEFGKIIEEEALTLHSHILSSTNGEVILLTPDSLIIIDKVRKFRAETKRDIYFTLDAGPNVHLLFPNDQEEDIIPFIEGELNPYYESYIADEMGDGPWKVL